MYVKYGPNMTQGDFWENDNAQKSGKSFSWKKRLLQEAPQPKNSFETYCELFPVHPRPSSTYKNMIFDEHGPNIDNNRENRVKTIIWWSCLGAGGANLGNAHEHISWLLCRKLRRLVSPARWLFLLHVLAPSLRGSHMNVSPEGDRSEGFI